MLVIRDKAGFRLCATKRLSTRFQFLSLVLHANEIIFRVIHEPRHSGGPSHGRILNVVFASYVVYNWPDSDCIVSVLSRNNTLPLRLQMSSRKLVLVSVVCCWNLFKLTVLIFLSPSLDRVSCMLNFSRRRYKWVPSGILQLMLIVGWAKRRLK